MAICIFPFNKAESIQRREDLLQELEYDKQLTRRDRENASEAVTHRAKELKEQVVEKKRQAEKAKKQYQLQLQEQRYIRTCMHMNEHKT